MSRILVLLSGYPCARSPWGNSQNHGTPDSSSFDSFYVGSGYLKRLLLNDQVDYLCTTWDRVGEDLIKRTFQPLLYKSYSQDQFRSQIDGILHSYEVERMERRTKYFSERELENNLVVSSIRFASQLQSRCDAAKLALELLDKTSESYDAILLTRYDISSRGGFLVRHPTMLKAHDFAFLSSSIEGPKFIAPCFGQLNCGFPDMWFYMNVAGLRYYSGILDGYISDITSTSSEYFRMMTEGWPFSRKFPMHSIYDYRQYSNEIFRTNSRQPLMTYPDWEVSNLHSYHKYYLYLSETLPAGSAVSFKGRLEILQAFLINSYFHTSKRSLFFEFLSHLRSLIKISFSRAGVRG